MAGSKGDGQVISADRVQEAITKGAITSIRGLVVTKSRSQRGIVSNIITLLTYTSTFHKEVNKTTQTAI